MFRRSSSSPSEMSRKNTSLDAIFRPTSVAVVGASRRKHQIGHEIVANLINNGFTGPVYPVNPTAEVVHSIPCYPKVTDIPGVVDLAVLVVPAKFVIPAAKDCAKKGVRGIVCISAGFGEIGGEGNVLQAQLLELCQKHGIRLIGPNCMGVLNTADDFSMNATFAYNTPMRGGAAFMSQSGALGEAILADAKDIGVGMSMFASLGNRADVSPADLLEYWEHDDDTRQILMYLESFGDPEHFMKIARRVSRKKPVVVVKSGRTSAGAKAAMSHTGSLAGSEAAADSLLSQCGVLRVDSMKDLFTLATAAQTEKLPKGKRVAIVTNAGGPAILATDACGAMDLDVVQLSDKTEAKIAAAIPAEASAHNPVDLIASADAPRFDAVLKAVLADRSVDMVMAIFVSPVMIDAEAVAKVFARHANRSKKPIVSCLLGKERGFEAVDILSENGVPNYRFPEDAATALAGLAKLADLRNADDGAGPRHRVQRKRARAVIDNAIKEGREILKGFELYELCSAYGIPVVPTWLVDDYQTAVRSAKKVGWPVALKIEAEEVIHKSDLGGVILDIRSEEEFRDAWLELEKRFRKLCPKMQVLVQAMRKKGVETFMGATVDPQYGRMLAFGLGGIHVEVLKDVVFRLHPLSLNDATEMVNGIRAKAMFGGVRGKPPVSKDQLVDMLLRLDRMLSDCPEILELDFNPFLAAYDSNESCVLDVRVRLALQ